MGGAKAGLLPLFFFSGQHVKFLEHLLCNFDILTGHHPSCYRSSEQTVSHF
jgi:hypothetical protein